METAAKRSREAPRGGAVPGKSRKRREARGPYAKSSETRTAILAAALEEATDVGLHRASVVNIARRAGVAVGNVHYHFGSRDKVLCEMLEALFAEYRASMGRAAAAHRTFFPAFEASVRAFLGYLHRYPALMRLEEESRLYYPKLYKRNVAAFLTETSDEVREAMRHGDLRPMSAGEGAVVAHLLMGMLHFVDQLIQKPGNPGDEAIVTACVRFVRHGLKGRS